ncbi:MAG: transglutaminase domain-containing protein [Cyclobacteriaceae bacterium]|jgi:transglutaminase-like putative cysteine protease|nr:transglutaminase domain-containing protein [Cyclobacteriaceae bacterium]
MSDLTNYSRAQQLLVRWLLVIVPTIGVGAFALKQVNFSYTALHTGISLQVVCFSLGLAIAYSLYFFRARVLVSLALLGVVYWVAQRVIVKLPGEFDVFYATARFELYATLFLIGWFFGLLLARVTWGYILLFAVLVAVSLVVASNTIDVSLPYVLVHVAPAVVYGVYMFFLSPVLATEGVFTWKRVSRLAVRTGLFVGLVVLMFFVVEPFFRGDLKAVEKELVARGAKEKDEKGQGSGGYDDRYGLMEKKDDGFRLKDTMRVNSRMSQSDQLMFCAKVNNFFPDGSPAPLYFVYHHLTRYDPQTESFTRDVNVPSWDEFDVDPATIPLYQVRSDSSIFRKAMGNRLRKNVTSEIYLSSNTWKHALLGPASVYSVQPIPVEKDFQKTFYSAYKVKSYTSELNNAYFVYNISANPALEAVQEQRHEELATVRDYQAVDPAFFDYYVNYPEGRIYDSIAQLARSLVPLSATPLEKVLAVRDHFLKRNASGKRIFRYTLKPGSAGDPNIPSSQMLYNFLFKTKAGYCTYYAGASLFMLRALGVPTRFTTGFATVDRSDKNKGWYWFYASQAHAWTQVYFPGYGWMDFDMTIGNEDQQSAPKPDGTPPLPPPDPWLVLNARVETTQPATRQLEATFQRLIFYTDDHTLTQPMTRAIDASLCRVLYDKKDTTFTAIQPGDSIIIVSYKDEAKKLPPRMRGVPIEEQVRRFPSPILADEIHIKPKPQPQKEDNNGRGLVRHEKKGPTWKEIAWVAAVSIGSLLTVLIFLPLLFLLWGLLRVALARDVASRADRVYQSTWYRLHMAGFERHGQTPLQYAEREIDPRLATGLADFMRMYLRLKYAGGSVREGDDRVVQALQKTLGNALHRHHGFFNILIRYFNLPRAWRFVQTKSRSEE